MEPIWYPIKANGSIYIKNLIFEGNVVSDNAKFTQYWAIFYTLNLPWIVKWS